jgi:hypothetical protein
MASCRLHNYQLHRFFNLSALRKYLMTSNYITRPVFIQWHIKANGFLTFSVVQLILFLLRVKNRSSNAGFFLTFGPKRCLHLSRHWKCEVAIVQRASEAENWATFIAFLLFSPNSLSTKLPKSKFAH